MLNTPWILTILPFPHCIWYFQARYLDILGTVSNCLRNDEQVLQTGAGESSKSIQRSQMRSRRNLTASRIKNGPLSDGKLSNLSTYIILSWAGKVRRFHKDQTSSPNRLVKARLSLPGACVGPQASNDSRIPNKNGTSPLPTAEKCPTSRTFVPRSLQLNHP